MYHYSSISFFCTYFEGTKEGIKFLWLWGLKDKMTSFDYKKSLFLSDKRVAWKFTFSSIVTYFWLVLVHYKVFHHLIWTNLFLYN